MYDIELYYIHVFELHTYMHVTLFFPLHTLNYVNLIHTYLQRVHTYIQTRFPEDLNPIINGGSTSNA